MWLLCAQTMAFGSRALGVEEHVQRLEHVRVAQFQLSAEPWYITR